MSDPNMDAADLHCDIQAKAFDDFQKWEDWYESRGFDLPDDIGERSRRYSREIDDNIWVIE
jgi:hypothetical protein